ncbi:hypothetical protein QTO34_009242 [Cnephaeus nilssonii]|uniref:Protein AATF n=1 Tax=Cnephaeus nilssonii TaxID=3371016 RepID=A0AA40LF74_CNENI|nr:hypothetical protein QTO34_009242 [Eptesicus nilssonii]
MAGSQPLALQLEQLLNPRPREADPEADPEEGEVTGPGHVRARAACEGRLLPVNSSKKLASASLLDTDKRYSGKTTSRKAWKEDHGSILCQVLLVSGYICIEIIDLALERALERLLKRPDQVQTPDSNSVVISPTILHSKCTFMPSLTFAGITFYLTFMLGLDLYKEISDEEESGDGDSEGLGLEESDEDAMSVAEEQEAEDRNSEDDGVVMTFSSVKVSEEVEKGRAVKNQIALWDQLLEGRIKLQKALLTTNQLPQPDVFPVFKDKGGPEFASALKNSHKALKALLRSLVGLQEELLFQYPDTRYLVDGTKPKAESEEEISSEDEELVGEKKKQKRAPRKRKLEMDDYPGFMAKRFADFTVYRNRTLQKWHDKTKLASGKLGKASGFGAFERSILTQIDHILMDKERLLRRTQTKRSSYQVLGKPEPAAQPVPETLPGQPEILPQAPANAHLKDLDEEIFDDDDFYHQLLRELIERKTSSLDPNDQVAMGRQWLAIQKLRSKIHKKVDRKASKGRKLRVVVKSIFFSSICLIDIIEMIAVFYTAVYISGFHVLSKLLSFMAPIDHTTMNDDAS